MHGGGHYHRDVEPGAAAVQPGGGRDERGSRRRGVLHDDGVAISAAVLHTAGVRAVLLVKLWWEVH